MELVTKEVHKIYENVSKTGKTYYVFETADGTKYSTFEAEIKGQEGETITFEEHRNGDFLNAKKLQVKGGSLSEDKMKEITAKYNAGATPKPVYKDKSHDIQLGQAMNQAVQIIANTTELKAKLLAGDWEGSGYEELVTGFINSNKAIRDRFKE